MAKIVRTITTPDTIGDVRVWAGQPKGGRYAGTDRASITLYIGDLADSPELVKLLAGQKVSITMDPSVARDIARDVPETAAKWAEVGIKPSAKARKARKAA
jgi:hypothetical protein